MNKFLVTICPPATERHAEELSDTASVVLVNETRLATFKVFPMKTDLTTPRPPAVCRLPDDRQRVIFFYILTLS